MKAGGLAAVMLLIATILGRVYGQLLSRLFYRIAELF